MLQRRHAYGIHLVRFTSTMPAHASISHTTEMPTTSYLYTVDSCYTHHEAEPTLNIENLYATSLNVNSSCSCLTSYALPQCQWFVISWHTCTNEECEKSRKQRRQGTSGETHNQRRKVTCLSLPGGVKNNQPPRATSSVGSSLFKDDKGQGIDLQ